MAELEDVEDGGRERCGIACPVSIKGGAEFQVKAAFAEELAQAGALAGEPR